MSVMKYKIENLKEKLTMEKIPNKDQIKEEVKKRKLSYEN